MIAICEMALWTNRSKRGPSGPHLCLRSGFPAFRHLPVTWQPVGRLGVTHVRPEGAVAGARFVRAANVVADRRA